MFAWVSINDCKLCCFSSSLRENAEEECRLSFIFLFNKSKKIYFEEWIFSFILAKWIPLSRCMNTFIIDKFISNFMFVKALHDYDCDWFWLFFCHHKFIKIKMLIYKIFVEWVYSVVKLSSPSPPPNVHLFACTWANVCQEGWCLLWLALSVSLYRKKNVLPTVD